ncbi:hypothetical protein CYY_009825 [Polysphondylium violaceum]|uniref:Transmembrane protein n=1 Tax=Polysphondylium violaceum TaxID=133409 RepID=A0A8J4PLM5_9MYCE|nr:hypothetical protein CYY_009825 [Polysphondylium violaceum]
MNQESLFYQQIEQEQIINHDSLNYNNSHNEFIIDINNSNNSNINNNNSCNPYSFENIKNINNIQSNPVRKNPLNEKTLLIKKKRNSYSPLVNTLFKIFLVLLLFLSIYTLLAISCKDILIHRCLAS